MSDSATYSYLIPPETREERAEWLREQEERIAAQTRSTLERIIDDATERFTNTLVATGDMAAFDSIPVQWEKYVNDDLVTQMQGLFLSGGVAMYMDAEQLVSIGENLATSWVTIVNDSATDYALEATNRLKDVGQGTWNTIKNNVSKAIEQGTSNENLRKILMENNRFSRVRADAIARTEVANAYNNGNWTGMQALGQYGPTHKYWIAAQVGNSRPEHLAKHGAMLPINEPYIVGGESMLYPHAPGVSAKNAVNCRCEVYWLYPGQQNPITGERAPQAAPVQTAPAAPNAPRSQFRFPQDLDDEGKTRRFANRTYSYVDEETGYMTRVDSVDYDSQYTYIDGVVLDADGEQIGDFKRILSEEYVEHDEFVLDVSAQGKGFASRFAAHVEDSYRDAGIPEIRLFASHDVGGYAWARQGYQLANDFSKPRVLENLRRTWSEWFASTSIPKEEHERLLGFILRNDLAGLAADKYGREALLGADYAAVKYL